ncbi:hypothetical protein EXS62_02540 [Candidatus Kaiserbacteria bacterium]|nr:hypothetical protein [Candidatus Kaiserbacteria bacterium]
MGYNIRMALKWSFRRQFLYYSVSALVMVVLALAVYQAFFNNAPSCSDGKRNGTETGVDCGGSCSLVCAAESHSPSVLWARAFRSSPQTYTAAAYVQNLNQGASARAVPYSLQLFDDKNLLIVEVEGTLDIPPVNTIPVVVPNINVGVRVVARTLMTFTREPVWQKGVAIPTLRIQNQKLSQDAALLSATVYNDSNIEARDAVATAVLFDQAGVARAASKSLVPRLVRKGSQDVVFTWGGGVPDIIRAEITVLPSI